MNHNAVFHPAFQKLLADVAADKLGRIEHVVSMNNLPLAQLDSGEHDHWMFRDPTNVHCSKSRDRIHSVRFASCWGKLKKSV